MMWQKWVLVGIFALSALTTIGQIGKPREPFTNANGVWAAVFSAISIGIILSIPEV